jgi:hypothetical protein
MILEKQFELIPMLNLHSHNEKQAPLKEGSCHKGGETRREKFKLCVKGSLGYIYFSKIQ